MPDLTDQIAAQAAEPTGFAVDGQSATNRGLGEVIQADQYLAGKAAAKKRRRGIRFSKLITPGNLPDCGRAGGFDTGCL